MEKYIFYKNVLYLFFFCFLLLCVRIFLRGQTLLLDEAEQVILGLKLLPGYPGQPPLYTWLQHGFFKMFGVNLFSIALLKYCLLFCCFYLFYLICRQYCNNEHLAFSAVASWALIPAIGLDLVKDNTHTILVLLMACATWYWVMLAKSFSKLIWYSILGCLIGLGVLSKFNYFVFIIILSLSIFSIGELRRQIAFSYLFLSFFVAVLVASPYLFWLYQETSIALSSAYKLGSTSRSLLQGIFELNKAIFMVTFPLLTALWIFFPKTENKAVFSIKTKILFRYHILLLPVLLFITIAVAIHEFRVRWLVPILFLCPVVYFSQIQYQPTLRRRLVFFLGFCLACEAIFLGILISSRYTKQSLNKQQTLNKILNGVRQSHESANWIVSDSYWLLGNLSLTLAIQNVWLLTYANHYNLPKGSCLLVWESKKVPAWVTVHSQSTQYQLSSVLDKKCLNKL
jgi:4-amino-4-deoxy-L-arabinose transferase-like glycosyltransferase